MSDKKLPRIPSFAELGISQEEIEELEREIAKEADTASESDPEPGDHAAGTAPQGERAASAAPGAPKGQPPSAKSAPRTRRFLVGGRKPKKAAQGSGPAPKAGLASPVGPASQAGSASPAGPASAVGSAETPSPAPPPWRGARGAVSLAILLVLAWFSSSFQTSPSPLPASAADSVFSSARAMTHLVRIASDAHPPGSPAHGRVREYLLEQLRGLGNEPTVQTTTSFARGGFTPRAATIRNVVARIPGSDPGGRAVLVTAHYDSREIARGAGDDGSGVVTILEALRALGERAQLRNDLIVLITDAEELGLLGARAFVDEHPWMDDVVLVVSIEMRGGGGPSMMFETGADNGWVIDALREADPYPVANSVSYEIYRRMSNDTDFTPFKEAGKQGLNFAGLGRAHVYHQVYDSPENFSEATLQHHGAHALAMLQHFGDAELATVNAPDVSYISVPILGLVTYGPLWIWLLGFLAVVGWVLTLMAGKRSGSRTSGVLVGVAASVVYLAAVGAAAFYLVSWRSGAHPEAGVLHAGVFHSEGWYVLAIVSIAFTLAAVILGLLRRWFTLTELVVGALFLPVALAAVATVMFPMAAMNFQWPALAGCVGALAVAGVPKRGRMGFLRWFLAVLAALPVVVVFTPLTESVWLAMGLDLAPVVAVLAGLALIMLLPVLDVAREPNGWWAPLAGLVAAGAFLAVGMSTATPSAERPAPSTLVYAMDRETGSAYWGTDPSRDDSDPGTRWAVEVAGPFGAAPEPATSESPGPLADFSPRSVRYALAAGDPIDVPPPTLAVVADSTVPSGMLRVTVTSEIGAEMMLLRFGEDGPRLVALNGRSLPGGGHPSRIEHWGTADGGVVLDFEQPAGVGELRFTVVEHHLRPGELLGNDRFARPLELAPNTRMLSDRAMIRTVFSVDAGTGAVRMETASELAGAEEDPGTDEESVAAEADTVAGSGDLGEADTAAAQNSAEADTATAARDSTEVIQPDTVQPDTIRPDTIPADHTASDRAAGPRFVDPLQRHQPSSHDVGHVKLVPTDSPDVSVGRILKPHPCSTWMDAPQVLVSERLPSERGPLPTPYGGIAVPIVHPKNGLWSGPHPPLGRENAQKEAGVDRRPVSHAHGRCYRNPRGTQESAVTDWSLQVQPEAVMDHGRRRTRHCSG